MAGPIHPAKCAAEHPRRGFANVPSQQDQRYRQIVRRLDAAARANLDRFVGIAELCRLAGVERRTLLRAFRAIHATTPSRYLRALRLDLAKQALLAPGAGRKTVTEVATRFGFRELGRFAADYRAAFGESPSETLRRAAPAVRRRPATLRSAMHSCD
jgi:transcriptional regulator GlxA family with amidase domain